MCCKAGETHDDDGRERESLRAAEAQVRTSAQPIWNSNAAASWSLLFSSAFGAFLQMLNWRALGESQTADDARGWFIVGLAMLAVYLVIGVFATDAKVADALSRAVGFAYLLLVLRRRSRAGKVRQGEMGQDYPRRGRGKPILIAIGAFIGDLLIAAAIGIVIGLALEALLLMSLQCNNAGVHYLFF
jgi:hypothetical protein